MRATFPDLGGDFVNAETGAGGEGQTLWIIWVAAQLEEVNPD